MTTAYTASNPVPLGAAPTTNGIVQSFLVNITNTGAATYAPDGYAAAPIYGMGGQALQGNEMVANGIATLASYVGPALNSGALCWVLLECTGGALQVGTATASQQAINQASGDARYGLFGNRIVNGGMAIDIVNEGATQTYTAGAALAHSVDYWYGYCTGANVTGQRVAGSGQSQYRYKFTGAASVTGIGFGQRIETLDSYDLNGSTAILSVDLANSLLTSVSWAAYYANSTDSFGTLASPTVTAIASGTFTVSSTITRYSTTIAIPSAATTGLQIVFSVGAQVSGTWTIGNVQLDPLSNIYNKRPIALERMLCQRRGRKSYSDGVVPGTVTNLGALGSQTISATDAWCNVQFAMPMRAIPTVTIYSNITGASGNAYYNQGAVDKAFIVGNLNTSGFFTIYRSAADLNNTSIQAFSFHYLALADL